MSAVERPAALPDRAELRSRCHQAIEDLDHALRLPAGKVGEPVDEAERAVVRLRDGLIDLLRQDSAGAESATYRSALKQVNASLSLIVGVEYPVGGVHRKLITQARDALQKVLDGDLSG
jgi:hypothetical protein